MTASWLIHQVDESHSVKEWRMTCNGIAQAPEHTCSGPLGPEPTRIRIHALAQELFWVQPDPGTLDFCPAAAQALNLTVP